MLIGIGISENVNLTKDTRIEDGKMYIGLQINPSNEEMVKAMMEGRKIEVAESSFLQFFPGMEKYGDKGMKSDTDLILEWQAFQTVLLEYGKLLAPKGVAENAIGGVKAFNKMGIPTEGIANAIPQLVDKAVFEKLYLAQFQLFVDFLSTIPKLEEIKFRHKFWRGSKKKTFAAIPKKSGIPFVESMQIPLEASTIGWSTNELEYGRNDDTEVAADVPSDTTDAADMFEAPDMSAPMGVDAPETADANIVEGMM